MKLKKKTGKKISIVAISAKNINKKRRFKIDKKIFFKKPLEIFKKKKLMYFLKLLVNLMVFQKR